MMGQSLSDVPIDQRYFEHYISGSVFDLGEIEVREADVIEFARRFDPQYFHIDPDAAQHSSYSGLIASGWHTAALMMRLCVDRYLSSVASLGSPGVDELRWTKPVRPGDVLRVRVTIVSTRRSTKKPDRGMVRSYIEVSNQRDEVVMHVTAMNLMRCIDCANVRERS
jgi:acyl dehydratase